MALLAVLLFICIVHGGRVTATTETSCSYWYSNTSRVCESNMDGVASVFLVCGIYVPCEAETSVKWFRKEYDRNHEMSESMGQEIRSQCINMSMSNKCESVMGLYKEYALYFSKPGKSVKSYLYQCQISTENNTVSLDSFYYPLLNLSQDEPFLSSPNSLSLQIELKCNSSQYNNCIWCSNTSIPACFESHPDYTEPSYNLTMTETYACTPYSIDMQTSNADSLSISSTLTRGYSNNQVATMSIEIPTGHATSDTVVKRDSRSDRPPTLTPSMSPTLTAKDESSKNNTVFAILGGIGGAAVVILLIAIIILQCLSLRRRRKRINYPVWERRDENANTLHMYSPPPPSGPAEPSPYECAVVNSSTLPGYTYQNTEGGEPTTVDHLYEDAEKYLRSDSHTSYPREDGGEEDDYAAPDDDISKINSPRASVVSENHPPQKKQSRVHFDTPETDMALKVSDEGHDYAVLQRNTCDVLWLENEALDQCTAALGPDTEKAETDQDKPPLEAVQASDREEHVCAILEVREEQDTSSGNELKDKSQEKSTNDFMVLSEVGGVSPPQRGEVTSSQEPALEEKPGRITPPQSKDSPSDCEPGSCLGEQETDVTFDDPIYSAKNTV